MEKSQHISLEVQIEDGEGKRRSGAKMDPWNPQNMSEQNRGTMARLKQAQEQKLHRIQRNFEKKQKQKQNLRKNNFHKLQNADV